MDSRMRLVVGDLVVPYLNRVRARVKEEALAPPTALEHRLRHAGERVLRGLHLWQLVVVASSCDDHLAPVALGDLRAECQGCGPRWASVEDEYLRLVVERLLFYEPDI